MKEAEYVETRVIKEKHRGGFNPFGFIFSLVFRILLSPFLIFIIAYIYFGNLREAVLVSLYAYTILTLLSIIVSAYQIFVSMITFNIFKFIKKSFKIILMFFALFFYWLTYIIIWGTNLDFPSI